MKDMGMGKLEPIPFDPREQPKRAIDFCLSMLMDTTGSMGSAINAVKVTIEGLLKKLESIKSKAGGRGGAIVGQIIQYKDYSNRTYTDNDCSIISNFSELRRRSERCDANGGACGGWCEDMQYGLK